MHLLNFSAFCLIFKGFTEASLYALKRGTLFKFEAGYKIPAVKTELNQKHKNKLNIKIKTRIPLAPLFAGFEIKCQKNPMIQTVVIVVVAVVRKYSQ
jgi:hypothetical protein